MLFLNGSLEAEELETSTDPESGRQLLENATDSILFDLELNPVPVGDDWYWEVYSLRNRETGAYLSCEGGVLSAKEELDDSCLFNITFDAYSGGELTAIASLDNDWMIAYDQTLSSFTVIPNEFSRMDNCTMTMWAPMPYTFSYFMELPE